MLIEITLIFLAVGFLLAASIEDIKKGEVSNKTSYGFLISALLASIFFSLYYGDFGIIINAFTGGILYFAAGFFMYMAGIWGGADVKILAGIGCVAGNLNLRGTFLSSLSLPLSNASPYVIYLVSLAISAVPYLVIYGIITCVRNPQIFTRFFKRFTTEREDMINEIKNPGFALILVMCLGLSILSALNSNVKFLVISLAIPVFFTIIFIYLRVVEKEGFTKIISVDDLKEFDRLIDSIEVNGVPIADTKIECVSLDEITRIKKLRDEGKIPGSIRVRDGMRFVPALLFGFLFSLL
jgi:hypothetical protein